MPDSQARPCVVVTGLGVVTPIGQSGAEFWAGLKEGRCGIRPVEGVELDGLKVRIAAQIANFDHASRLASWERDKSIMHSGRFCWLAAAAADEAIKQSGLEVPFANADRIACIIGSAAGGQISAEIAARDRFISGKRAVHPMLLPRMVCSSAAAHIGIEHGVKGPTYAVCSAGASAAHAIGIGRDYIRNGLVDVAIVGGSESTITYGALMACQAMHLLSPEGCFPFSKKRTGTVLAEGAGVLVLESERHARARGARMLAELCGFGMTSGAHDMVGPQVDAAAEAMRRALEDAKIAPNAIDYLNAHGTGTIFGDLFETRAVKQVFGKHAYAMSLSSTKSMHGHPLGAAAAIEAVACIKAMETSLMPPTLGLDERDPECDLDYVPHTARKKSLTYTMSNSFALSALNAAIAFGPPPDSHGQPVDP
jgi:nodulation protein E